jgi:hypothetical protein
MMGNTVLIPVGYLKNKEKQKMIELITISKAGETWYLNKVIVNSQHIAIVIESRDHNRLLREGKINLDLDAQVQFSKVKMATVSGFDELIAIGSPAIIMEKMNRNTKQLLKG